MHFTFPILFYHNKWCACKMYTNCWTNKPPPPMLWWRLSSFLQCIKLYRNCLHHLFKTDQKHDDTSMETVVIGAVFSTKTNWDSDRKRNVLLRCTHICRHETAILHPFISYGGNKKASNSSFRLANWPILKRDCHNQRKMHLCDEAGNTDALRMRVLHNKAIQNRYFWKSLRRLNQEKLFNWIVFGLYTPCLCVNFPLLHE